MSTLFEKTNLTLRKVSYFTASTTWEKSSLGISKIFVQVLGGGGSGSSPSVAGTSSFAGVISSTGGRNTVGGTGSGGDLNLSGHKALSPLGASSAGPNSTTTAQNSGYSGGYSEAFISAPDSASITVGAGITGTGNTGLVGVVIIYEFARITV